MLRSYPPIIILSSSIVLFNFKQLKNLRIIGDSLAMTSRIPRLWQPGNPKTRVFLPDFWVKLVETPKVGISRLPKYAAMFEVDPRMSRTDVREYLVKIYKLPVRDVRTMNKMGEISWMWPRDRKNRKAMWKEEDRKMAYVFFSKNFNAEIPALFPQSADSVDAQVEKAKEQQETDLIRSNEEFANKERLGVGRMLP